MRSSMGNAAPPAASTEQSTIVLSPQEQRERQALFAGMESRQMGMGTGVSWNRGGLAGSEGSRNSPRPVQTEGGLTPEEERQRNAMRARTDISFSRADGIGNRGTHAEGGGISWGHSREDTPGVVWGKQPVTRSAPVVRRVRINQPVHGSDEPSRQPNPDLASSWKHIRRVASAPTASAPFQEPQEFAPSASPDSRRSEYLRQRQQREQQAMRGEYVGLVADKPPPQCYRCGQIGHLARHCTKTMTFDFRDVPCHHCGRRGHAMAACPQLKPFQSLTPPGSTTSEPAAQPAAARAIKAGIYSEISASVGGSKPDVARTEGQDPRYQELADMERSYIKRPEMPQPDTERSVRLRLRRREARQSDPDELDEDLLMIEAERADERKRHQRKTERAKQKGPVTKTLQPLYLPEFITVANLATALRVRVDEFIHKMGDMGFESVRGDHVLNSEDAGLIVSEYGYEPIIDHAGNEEEEDLKARPEPDDTSLLPPRPPVVTIMGHVDHGKTTILDYLRKSSVAASEFGGITQHIGAFSVQLSSGKMITFLDTPGHAAFLSMRQRGATVTDIVVLVVAADDSVKPQTIEAIKHAQAAGVPIIVAINKIDKDEAAPDRVKNDLAVNGINVEDFGGDTQAVLVSGKTGQGVDQLEEAIVTLSEIQDHRADMEGPVEGWVLEAATKRAGRVATVLVRRGTLSPGDIIVAGTAWARVRQLRNEAGVAVDSAAPGTAVEVDGWREPPTAGDEVLQAPNEQKATAVVQLREKNEDRKRLAQDIEAINESRRLTQEKREQEKLAASGGSNEADAKPQQQAPTQATGSGRSEIPFIVKADVSGSAEAVLNAVSALGNGEIRANILRAGVGAPSEFDIEHASAAKGHIISFNTNLDSNILQMAEQRGVRILDHKIIYHLVDDVKACLSEHLPPLVTQRVTGEADVAQVFSITLEKRKQKQIAGSKVRNGQITKNSKARVLRGKEIVYDGTFHTVLQIPHLLLRIYLLPTLDEIRKLTTRRGPDFPQKCQERRHRDAEGHRMRHRLPRLGSVRGWRPDPVLRRKVRKEIPLVPARLDPFQCSHLPTRCIYVSGSRGDQGIRFSMHIRASRRMHSRQRLYVEHQPMAQSYAFVLRASLYRLFSLHIIQLFATSPPPITPVLDVSGS